MVIGKRHTPNRFSFTVTIFNGIYILYHEGNHTLLHEHFDRGNSAVLALKFACT